VAGAKPGTADAGEREAATATTRAQFFGFAEKPGGLSWVLPIALALAGGGALLAFALRRGRSG
jgi:hypothetical protein